MPSEAEIQAVVTNIQNMMDMTNHLQANYQPVIDECYMKISETRSDDGQSWANTLLSDSISGIIGSLPFPGSNFIGDILGGIYNELTNSPPDNLKGVMGDVWNRFENNFLDALDKLAAIHDDPVGHWNDSFKTIYGGTAKVSDLVTAKMPDQYSTDFQHMADKCVARYRVDMAKYLMGKKNHITRWQPENFFPGMSVNDVKNWAPGFIKKNKAYYLEDLKYVDDGDCCTPHKGTNFYELSVGGNPGPFTDAAITDDTAEWLFKDDGFGTVTNEDGVATREDVFKNWGLKQKDYYVPNTYPALAEKANMRDAVAFQDLLVNKGRRELEDQIIKKAWSDVDFRRSLQRNPRETLEKELGFKIPDNVAVNIFFERPHAYGITIPWVGIPEGLGPEGE
jgi:hypothetical protein